MPACQARPRYRLCCVRCPSPRRRGDPSAWTSSLGCLRTTRIVQVYWSSSIASARWCILLRLQLKSRQWTPQVCSSIWYSGTMACRNLSCPTVIHTSRWGYGITCLSCLVHACSCQRHPFRRRMGKRRESVEYLKCPAQLRHVLFVVEFHPAACRVHHQQCCASVNGSDVFFCE